MTDKAWRKLCSELGLWKEGQMCNARHVLYLEHCPCGSSAAPDVPHEIPLPNQTDKAVLWEVLQAMLQRDFQFHFCAALTVNQMDVEITGYPEGYWEGPDLLTAAAKALGIDPEEKE